MIDFTELDFTNKTVLEVGTGRGGTTIELAKALKNFRGLNL
ncbi:class I SAM-dependent methyltransferase [Proteiniborus sp. MB09-C3]|nr:class I SAM-dependent methyltransferase [Proteiniborus sp. MB09-C3]WIV12708.1 class I SAM-dependent methyltransferase [Proteiniborus sp. MB09-C3]